MMVYKKNRQHECEKYHDSRREECLEAYNKSYDEYERERKQIEK